MTNFDGLQNLDNGLIYQLFIMPADMNGDVGPNHYVQFVNSLIRVYDKTGQPMGPPQDQQPVRIARYRLLDPQRRPRLSFSTTRSQTGG